MDVKETYELTRFNVISSRIRLARNVEGLPFPHRQTREDREECLAFMKGADAAAKGLLSLIHI